MAKIHKIQIAKISNNNIKAISSLSERNGGNTQELLKHAKNKYYLKREHLNEIIPPRPSTTVTPLDQERSEAKKILPEID